MMEVTGCEAHSIFLVSTYLISILGTYEMNGMTYYTITQIHAHNPKQVTKASNDHRLLDFIAQWPVLMLKRCLSPSRDVLRY